MKKILQIRKGEYLLEIRDTSIATTHSQYDALDISNLSLDALGYLTSGLRSAGYTKYKVLIIEV